MKTLLVFRQPFVFTTPWLAVGLAAALYAACSSDPATVDPGQGAAEGGEAAGACVPECEDGYTCVEAYGLCVPDAVADVIAPDGTPDPGDTVPLVCLRTADCAVGFICQEGFCVPDIGGTACTSDRDCARDQACILGTCLQSCEAPEDCTSGVCLLGVCVGGEPQPGPGGACDAQNPCPGLLMCMNGQCVAPGGEGFEGAGQAICFVQADCRRDERCVQGRCVWIGDLPPACGSDDDCGPGKACVEGFCSGLDELVPCQRDRDCGADEVCREGYCAPSPPPSFCLDSRDCTGGLVCVERICVIPGPGDDPCGPEGVFCEGSEGFEGTEGPEEGPEGAEGMEGPEGGEGPEGAGVECLNDRDCPEGTLCADGACVPENAGPCVNDRDCPEGTLCDNGACVPESVNPPPPSGCKAGADCARGERCNAQGQCEATGGLTRCQSDVDCGAGQKCQLGFCTTPCQSDADCNGGSCIIGVCFGGGGGGSNPPTSCVRDADCGDASLICEAGACVPVPGASCQRDSDCPTGQICEQGVCGAPPAGSDGGTGGGGSGLDCLRKQCPTGEECDWRHGQCHPTDGSCATDAHCPPGLTCSALFKLCTGCQADNDCNFGQQCTLSACRERTAGP